MLQNHYHYVLVGGGLASSSAAAAIRRVDRSGSILLLGQEVYRPYHRPRLNTLFITGQQNRTEIGVEPPGWYAAQGIELASAHRATRLDTHRRSVAVSSGQEIAYDKLLIATGASAKPLTIAGAQLPNVLTLRTIDDADRLHNAIEKAKLSGLPHASSAGRGRVAIVGGGLLGLELVNTLTTLGLEVDWLLADEFPLSKFVGENTGRLLLRLAEQHGVRVHPNANPTRLEGDGRVQRVVTDGGDPIACDFVLAAIGIQPNKDLLRGTPLLAEKAILANEHCQTNIPDIYTAGDCAAIFDPLFAKHRPMPHWQSAIDTGTIAGTHMAGAAARFSGITHFRTELFGVEIQIFGEGKFAHRRHLRTHPRATQPAFAEISVAADGRITQIVSLGTLEDPAAFEALITSRTQITGREEMLKDPTSALGEFLN